MKCLLAIHGTSQGATQDTLDSLLPLMNGAACDVVVAAPEEWSLGVMTVGKYSGELDPRNYGFRLLSLVNACYQSRRTYDCVILTDDRCLGVSRNTLLNGLKLWFEQHNLGAIGVLDDCPRYVSFEKHAPCLAEWGLPFASWRPSSPPLLGGFLLMNGKLVQKMFDQALLPPPGWQQWTTTFGDYLSIVTQVLKFEVFGVGTGLRHRLPLFVAGDDTDGRLLVSPTVLRSEFMIYHPIDKVYGVTAQELRNAYKELREGRG